MPTPADVKLEDTVRLRFLTPPVSHMVTFDRQPSKIMAGFVMFGSEPKPAGVPEHAKPVQWQGIWFWGWD